MRAIGWFAVFLSLLSVPLAAQDTASPPPERAMAPLEVVTSPGFHQAIERGTRTRSGVPGPRYWQQRVDYRIDATIEPSQRLLAGDGTVVYHNNSPDSLSVVVFHLYQNLFAEGALRTRPVPITGGVTLTSLEADGQRLEVDPADNHQTIQRGTIMIVRLPEPLLPGGEITFRIGWHFTVPAGEGVPRMGMVDSTTGQIAQWYPQIATYDDIDGWDTHPYLSNAEFYLEYGTFDVSVTAPAGTVVRATGVLQNPADVLPRTVRDRLDRARRGDEVVHVVTADDFGPGKATLGKPGDSLTWRFHADDVRDFAFAFGDHYLWDATRATIDERAGARTFVETLYRPSAATWTASARMAKDAIETFSRNVYPYQYPHIVATEGLVGGMEYPMIVFVRDFDDESTTDRVIAHELGHMWFPMMVGSNETRYAWMDEGINTFDTIFAAEHYDPSSPERSEVRKAYEGYTAHNDIQGLSVMSPPDAIAAGDASVGILGYRHPASALLALRETLGAETFDKALHEYAARWLYKHPAPWDFFDTFEDVAGQDLDWFWVPWFYGPGVSDLAISDVDAHAMGGENHVVVTVRNDGTTLNPIVARITTVDGHTALARRPASVWFGGKKEVTVEATVEGDVQKVELDPEDLYADVDSSDDVWSP